MEKVKIDPQKRNELVGFIRNLSLSLDSSGQKWFICFGTLLFLLRDKIFNMQQDIDIGIVGDPIKVCQVLNNAYTVNDVVFDTETKHPLKTTYMCERPRIMIDVFFWKKVGNMYYHIEPMENPIPKSGFLNSYKFKGIPAECFDMPENTIEALKRDVRYEGAVKNNGTWNRMIPGLETEGISVAAPYEQGRCLDIWYPNWALAIENYGTSMSEWIKEVRNCKDLK